MFPIGPNIDDDLMNGYTDNDGRFLLYGSEKELSTIDPVLKVYHDCNDRGLVRVCKLYIQRRNSCSHVSASGASRYPMSTSQRDADRIACSSWAVSIWRQNSTERRPTACTDSSFPSAWRPQNIETKNANAVTCTHFSSLVLL